MDIILQMAFWNAFASMEKFWVKQLSLFLSVHLALSQHWLRQWRVAEEATSLFLIWLDPNCLTLNDRNYLQETQRYIRTSYYSMRLRWCGYLEIVFMENSVYSTSIPWLLTTGRPKSADISSHSNSHRFEYKADSRFAPSQWEAALLCNDVSHCLGASLGSALWVSGRLTRGDKLCRVMLSFDDFFVIRLKNMLGKQSFCILFGIWDALMFMWRHCSRQTLSKLTDIGKTYKCINDTERW